VSASPLTGRRPALWLWRGRCGRRADRAVAPTQRHDDVHGSTSRKRGIARAPSTNRQPVRPGGDFEPIRQTVVAECEIKCWLSGLVRGDELDWHRPLDFSHSPQVDYNRCRFGHAAAPKKHEQRGSDNRGGTGDHRLEL
jgi:hypothetical protein